MAALLAACVGLAYQGALGVGFLSDDHLMLAFASIAPLDGSVFAVNPIRWLLYHRPFALLVWQLMYAAWGMHPLPYHLLSLALHALNSLLIVALARRVAPGDPPTAVAAGLVFALLPLNVEAVVWLACWFDLLALACALGSLLSLIEAWGRRRLRWYLLSLALFQLAIWSKETAFVTPALAVAAVLFLRPRPPARLIAAGLLPYGLLIGANLLQRYLAWGFVGGNEGVSSNALPFLWDRLLDTLRVLLAPLNRLLFPPEVVQLAGALTAAALLLGLIAGGRRRAALFGVLWFAVALAPGFSVLAFGLDLQNGRLLYFAGAGYAMLLGAALTNLTALLGPRFRGWAQVALAAALGLAAVAAIRVQVGPWLVATRATEAIVAQIDSALPPPRLGTYLQVSGLPDNYRGAYIFRIGPDPALLNSGKGLYLNQPAQQPGPIPYDALGLDRDFFQVQLRADEAQQRWEIAQARGVTIDAPHPPLSQHHWIMGMGGADLVARMAAETPRRPPAQGWDPGDCAAVGRWQTAGLTLECAPGTGTLVTPTGSDPMIVLPGVSLRTDRWTEVVVALESLGPLDGASAQLYWGTQTTGLDEARSASIELPATPRPYSYHFFIPPSPDGAALDVLRLDPVNGPFPVRITGIEARQDP